MPLSLQPGLRLPIHYLSPCLPLVLLCGPCSLRLLPRLLLLDHHLSHCFASPVVLPFRGKSLEGSDTYCCGEGYAEEGEGRGRGDGGDGRAWSDRYCLVVLRGAVSLAQNERGAYIHAMRTCTRHTHTTAFREWSLATTSSRRGSDADTRPIPARLVSPSRPSPIRATGSAYIEEGDG
jgi:hypothetical protein